MLMVKWSVLLTLVIGQPDPGNLHLSMLRSDGLKLINRELFEKPGRIERLFMRLVTNLSTILPRLKSRNCLHVVFREDYSTSGTAECSVKAIEFITEDYNTWLDVYIDVDVRPCANIRRRQKTRLCKLTRRMQALAKDNTMARCPDAITSNLEMPDLITTTPTTSTSTTTTTTLSVTSVPKSKGPQRTTVRAPSGSTDRGPSGSLVNSSTSPDGFAALSGKIDLSLTYCSAADNGFSRINERIVGGSKVASNSWPSIVNLNIHGFQCGGTLIANHWVLTAAHCCMDGATLIIAMFGGSYFQQSSGAFHEESSEYFIHPSYSGSNADYCLIKFEEDILSKATYNNVQIACLPTSEVVGGEACWVAGWGLTSFDNYYGSTELLSTGINILSHQYCKDNSFQSVLSPDDICAGVPDNDGDGQTDGGKDSCQGDSGGPLICPIDGKATLVGVVSRGYGCAWRNTAGLYSSTYFARQWIKDTISNNS